MPSVRHCAGVVTYCSRRRVCNKPPGKPTAREQAAREAAARELVYGGQEPPRIPWGTVGFTAAILGSYVAYYYLVESPADRRYAELHPETVKQPLPPKATQRLADGRLLMEDGSIRKIPP
jgi:hypothetical protein